MPGWTTQNAAQAPKEPTMSPWLPIKSLFADPSQVGQSITVKGWLRSKRDSKAGISFLAVHDGTCFDAIQAVVPNTLTNYDEEELPHRKEKAYL